MIFDRTAGGHRFDYRQGFCVVCGITREEFKDNDYPKCTGELYGVRQFLRIVILRKPHRQLSASDHLAAGPAARAGAVPAAVRRSTNDDQVDDSTADAGDYHSNSVDSNRSGARRRVLLGWL